MSVTKVFLSSTTRDLKAYREAVGKAVDSFGDYKAIWMDNFPASGKSAQEFCREKVGECHLYVGLFAENYGDHPTGEDRSYTELEYEAAAGINRMIFLSGENLLLPASAMERDPDRYARQQAFRARAGKEQMPKFFNTIDELVELVRHALRDWEREQAAARSPGKSDLRSAVDQFRRDYEQVREGTLDLEALKTLHDQLHSLPKNCLNPLLTALRAFPDPDRDAVEGADHNLGRALIEITGKARTRPNLPVELDWIPVLEQARADLQAGLEENDQKRFRQGVGQVKSVLERQPVIINEKMKSLAGRLGLKQLVTDLSLIHQQLAGKLSEEANRHLDDCFEQLERLGTRLEVLIAEHDTWQRVDQQLRPIEATLSSKETDQIKDNWPFLRDTAEPLFPGNAKLAGEGQKLEAALEAADDPAIRQNFRRFANVAFFAFLEVDTTLKNFCGGELTS